MQKLQKTTKISTILQAGAIEPNLPQSQEGWPKPSQLEARGGISSKTDEQLNAIIAAGLSELPTVPTQQDYIRFNTTKEAIGEQVRRSVNPLSGSRINIAPKIR